MIRRKTERLNPRYSTNLRISKKSLNLWFRLLVIYDLILMVKSSGIFEFHLNSLPEEDSKEHLCDPDLFDGCQISTCLWINKVSLNVQNEFLENLNPNFKQQNCNGFLDFSFKSDKISPKHQISFDGIWTDKFELGIQVRQMKTNKTFFSIEKSKNSFRVGNAHFVLPIHFQRETNIENEYESIVPFLVESYIKCKPGWTGKNCETVLKCDCLNGECDRITGSCVCNFGYEGEKCDQCIKDKRCQGTCNKPRECICPPGKGGRFCEIDNLYCSIHKPCQNNGACTNVNGSYACTCQQGFFGKNCEHRIRNCQPNSCQNNAQCIESTNNPQGFYCKCPPGVFGRYCQVRAKSCMDRPCSRNNAITCKNLVPTQNLTMERVDTVDQLTFQCVCESGWAGAVCDVSKKWCPSNACFNGGTCVQSPNNDLGYVCACPHGFQGLRCEQSVHVCQKNLCQNNGICLQNNSNGFRCLCPDGFDGKYCEMDASFAKNNQTNSHHKFDNYLTYQQKSIEINGTKDDFWISSSAKFAMLLILIIVVLLLILIFHVQKINKNTEIQSFHPPPHSMTHFDNDQTNYNIQTISKQVSSKIYQKKLSENFYNDLNDDESGMNNEERYVAEPALRPGPEAQRCLEQAAHRHQRSATAYSMDSGSYFRYYTGRRSHSDDSTNPSTYRHSNAKHSNTLSPFNFDGATLMPPKSTQQRQKHTCLDIDFYRDGVEDAERIYEEIPSPTSI